MKTLRFLGLVTVAMLAASPAFAALQADAAWEVRTSGNNNNGSCYDTGGSGTDYSVQDASQLSITDGATSGAGSTTLTSAAAGFTSAMVDNCIRIRSGTNFDVGYYEITAFTNSSTVTLDRTPSAGGAGSGGTGEVGGAAADPEQVTAGVVAGNTVYVKAGTYNVILDTDTAGTTTSFIRWIGYNASRGDNPTGTNRPLIDGASTRANCIVSDQGGQFYKNWRCSGATGDGILDSTGASTQLYWNVSSSSNAGDGWDDSGGNNANRSFMMCESNSNTGAAMRADAGGNASSSGCLGCYLHDNTSSGFAMSAGFSVAWSVAEGNGADAWNDVTHCINSMAISNTGAGTDGFLGAGNGEFFVNCASRSNGGIGFSGTSGAIPFFDYNGYGSNGTNLSNVTAGDHDVTSDPSFTNAGAGDFTISAGSSYLAAGFPQDNLPGMTGDYQTNIGIDQDDNASGAATNMGAWGF